MPGTRVVGILGIVGTKFGRAMWNNVTRASGRYDCRLDWSGISVEPLPQVQDVPFDRAVPAAEKKRFRHCKCVSISKTLSVRSRPAVSPETRPNPNMDSFRELRTSRK